MALEYKAQDKGEERITKKIPAGNKRINRKKHKMQVSCDQKILKQLHIKIIKKISKKTNKTFQ